MASDKWQVVSDKKITLSVTNGFAHERLDRFVCNSLKDISRAVIKKLIDENLVLVNERLAKPSYRVKKDDKVLVLIPELKEARVKPELIPLEVVFEDKDIIVVNKPQGMVTHVASGNYSGTLVNALLHHSKDSLSGIGGVLRPGIVHRLDKETSGLIIACKNDKSHRDIANQIKERILKRFYYVVVHGNIKYDKGVICKPIGRHKTQKQKMAVVQGGRNAITKWEVLKRLTKYTFLECSLETGRTHQIRVHMSSIGHPIVGDETYGKRNDPLSKMMLHAYKLVFVHPSTRKKIKLETKLPQRFDEFITIS